MFLRVIIQGNPPDTCQARQQTPVISSLRKLRQEDLEFKDSLGYVVRPYLRKTKQVSKLTNKEKDMIGQLNLSSK